MITSTREQLESSGFKITKEVIDSKGNHFLRLDNGTEDTCLVVRDNANEKFFLIDIYDNKRAEAFLVKVAQQ